MLKQGVEMLRSGLLVVFLGLLPRMGLAAELPLGPNDLELQIVLTHVELNRTVERLWSFAMSADGGNFLQNMTSSAESEQAWGELLQKLREERRRNDVLVAYAPVPVAPNLVGRVKVRLFYDRNALMAAIKCKADEYFLSHTWTRWGEIFPRSGARIRQRQVNRPGSLYNRKAWEMLLDAEPRLLATAGRKADELTSAAIRNGEFELIPGYGSPAGAVRGYFTFLHNGNVVASTLFPERGYFTDSEFSAFVRQATGGFKLPAAEKPAPPALTFKPEPYTSHDGIAKVVVEPWEALLARVLAIRAAKSTIDISVYTFNDDESGTLVLGELQRAVARGVKVRILVDSFGTLNYSREHLAALYAVRGAIEIKVFNLMSAAPGKPGDRESYFARLHRTHDKIFLVDDSLAIIGGRNIANEYFGVPRIEFSTYNDADVIVAPSGGDTRHLMTEIKGHFEALFTHPWSARLPEMGRAQCDRRLSYYAQFSELWLGPTSALGVKLREMSALNYLHATMAPVRASLVHERENVERLFVPETGNPPHESGRSISNRFHELLACAKHDIQIVSPYLYLFSTEIEALKAWIEADPSRTIRIVTPSLRSTDEAPAQSLIDLEWGPSWAAAFNTPALKKRARLYSFGSREGTPTGGRLHAKLLVVDGETSLVTSSNMDALSRYGNSEVGLVLEGRETAASLIPKIDSLVGSSSEWGSEEWSRDRSGPDLADKLTQQKHLYEMIRDLKLRNRL